MLGLYYMFGMAGAQRSFKVSPLFIVHNNYACTYNIYRAVYFLMYLGAYFNIVISSQHSLTIIILVGYNIAVKVQSPVVTGCDVFL